MLRVLKISVLVSLLGVGGCGGGSGGSSLSAVFTIFPNVAYPIDIVSFDSSHSIGLIVSYSWDFGDENSTARNPNTSSEQNPSHYYPVPGMYTVSLTIVDEEGRLDVATCVGCVEILPEPGDGFFVDSGQELGESDSTSVVLGDVDGDGDLDMVVGNGPAGATGGIGPQMNRVYTNDGNGFFSDSGQELGSILTGIATSSLALGDIDGDGDLDLIEGNYGGTAGDGTYDIIYKNNGNGVFTDTRQLLGPGRTQSVALGDIDSDGDLDIVVGLIEQPNRVYVNDGNGNFSDSGQELGNFGSRSVALGDIDGDGDLDMVVANWQSEPDRYYLNNGSGVFNESDTFTTGIGDSWTVALGDIDGDGDLDLIVGHYSGHFHRVYMNIGGQFFDTDQDLGLEDYGDFAVLGDIDSDEDLDLIVGAATNCVFINDGTSIYANSGQELGLVQVSDVALGDIDGDGDLDIVTANGGTTQIDLPNRVYFNIPN